MTDLNAVMDIVAAVNTPLLGFLCWLVWRLYSNHLPHFQNSLDSINARLLIMEGRQQERDKHVANS